MYCCPLTCRVIGSNLFGLASLPRDGQPWPNMAILSVFAGYQDDGECVYAYVTLPFTFFRGFQELALRIPVPPQSPHLVLTASSTPWTHRQISSVPSLVRFTRLRRVARRLQSERIVSREVLQVCTRPFDVCKDSRAVADYGLARV